VGGLEKRRAGVAYNQLKPKDTRTLAQKAALIKLLTDLKSIYPNAKIYGHRDFTNKKACPSFDAKSEYKAI
jgi:N-acetylmuramoyl-L-alanine amidase